MRASIASTNTIMTGGCILLIPCLQCAHNKILGKMNLWQLPSYVVNVTTNSPVGQSKPHIVPSAPIISFIICSLLDLARITKLFVFTHAERHYKQTETLFLQIRPWSNIDSMDSRTLPLKAICFWSIGIDWVTFLDK